MPSKKSSRELKISFSGYVFFLSFRLTAALPFKICFNRVSAFMNKTKKPPNGKMLARKILHHAIVVVKLMFLFVPCFYIPFWSVVFRALSKV
jgi:hypothetical protein